MPGQRKRTSRKHEVRAKLGIFELTKLGTSLKLELYSSGERLGTLEIGRGSVYWRGGKRVKGKRVPWNDFAAHMDELAYRP
jgi:hypothetical protein